MQGRPTRGRRAGWAAMAGKGRGVKKENNAWLVHLAGPIKRREKGNGIGTGAVKTKPGSSLLARMYAGVDLGPVGPNAAIGPGLRA